MNRLFIIASVLFASVSSVMAQDEPMYKWEIGGGVGMMTYEGDFNGSIFSSNSIAPTASVMLRRVFNPYTNLRLDLGFGQLKGKSSNMDTYYPKFNTATHKDSGNEYSFSNTALDLSTTFEYNFWPYGTGRDYRGAKRITPFIFLGLGFTFANNKNGNVDYSSEIDSTEIFTPSNQSVFTAALITGVGVKYKIAKRLNIGLEWGIHFTFSDYLDGVKDPYMIASSGMFKNTDCFSVLKASVTYNFGPKCITCMNQDWHY